MPGSDFIPAGEHYFKNRVIPREKKEEIKQQLRRRAAKGHEKPKRFYRRKLKTTEDGGQPYKQCIPLNKLAQFGLGLAMYFYILLILCVTCIFTGFISIPRIAEFTRNNHDNNITDVRVFGAAVCPDLRRVELYGGVQADFRPRCDFPDDASTWSDFCICIGFAVAILLAVILQHYIENRLDERVASAQDYSIVIENPPEDADSPDEWKDFFSQYGLVRYITVNRQNRKLLILLLKKRLLLRHFPPRYYTDAETTELDEKARFAAQTPIPWKVRFLYDNFGIVNTTKDNELLFLLHQLNVAIDASCNKPHVVSSIFVTFEFEDEKQRCLQALENENSFMNKCRGRKNYDNRFRGEYVLLAEESSEPDNIAWLNSSLDDPDRLWRKAVSFFCTAVILVICYWLVQAAYDVSALALLIVITGLDSTLPFVFMLITGTEGNVDEDDRQESFMMKLFVGRILCAVIFPLLFTPWESMLDVTQLASIKNVQLSCCFVTPLVRLVDAPGIFNRQIMTRFFAKSESDALRFWSGTPFTLAERYTDIAKIMFISLFYSFLDPTALFLAALACLNSFFIDRYLLLRKSAPPPLLDNSMGPTVFKLLALALLAKIIMSLYFAYSWTFDDIYFDDFGNYQKIDKTPPDVIWKMEKESWHTDLQWRAISYYIKYANVAICYCFCLCFYHWFGGLYLFCAGAGTDEIKCTNQQPYSSISNVICYCPVVRYGPESFLAADTTEMMRKHRPDTIDLNDRDDQEFNFESYLPSNYDATCLAKVKWYTYPHDDKELGNLSATSSKRSLQRSDTPVLNLVTTPVRSAPLSTPDPAKRFEPTQSYASGHKSPARFGRIIGGRNAVLAPLNESEKDSDITKKLRKELNRPKRGRFSSSAAIDPSGSGLVDFDGFVALLRDRCPMTCQVNSGNANQVSPSCLTHLDNKLKGVFLNELLRQNRRRNSSSDMVDFDDFLDHMRGDQRGSSLRQAPSML